MYYKTFLHYGMIEPGVAHFIVDGLKTINNIVLGKCSHDVLQFYKREQNVESIFSIELYSLLFKISLSILHQWCLRKSLFLNMLYFDILVWTFAIDKG